MLGSTLLVCVSSAPSTARGAADGSRPVPSGIAAPARAAAITIACADPICRDLISRLTVPEPPDRDVRPLAGAPGRPCAYRERVYAVRGSYTTARVRICH